MSSRVTSFVFKPYPITDGVSNNMVDGIPNDILNNIFHIFYWADVYFDLIHLSNPVIVMDANTFKIPWRCRVTKLRIKGKQWLLQQFCNMSL